MPEGMGKSAHTASAMPSARANATAPRCSIVIVSWNTERMLRACLDSVFAETRSPIEVYVVDNASGDGSAEMVAREFPAVRLIANRENRGFAPANNQALVEARGETLLLLNPDTVVLDGAIDAMLDWLDEHPEAGAVSCRLLNSDGTLQKSAGSFYSFWGTLLDNRVLPVIMPSNRLLGNRFLSFWNHGSVRRVDWARGAVLMVRRAAAEEVGLLDEQFYIYGEEIDWCYRLAKAGWPLFFLPHARIVHHGKASSNQRRTAMFIQNQKSFYQFLRKHYPRRSYWIYRSRVMVLLLGWLAIFGASLLSTRRSHRREQLRATFDAYLSMWRWHWSPESRNIRREPQVPRLGGRTS